MTTPDTKSSLRTLVIHPTVNEGGNLRILIPQVLAQGHDVLVVDDGSTDGTADWLRVHPRFDSGLFLIQRPRKMGLGTAYVEGFQWAMRRGYDIVVEMDADLSHRPEDLPAVLAPVLDGCADIGLGSRYIGGVRVLNWPMRRLILSAAAMKYARFCLGWHIDDATSGFKAIHRRVFDAIALDRLRSNGYVFQVELNYRAHRAGMRIVEVPIVFVERSRGESKMNLRVIIEAITRIPLMRLLSFVRRGYQRPAEKSCAGVPIGACSR